MTHEEFKAVCLQEFPKIEGMVKTVKALSLAQPFLRCLCRWTY